MKTIPRRICLFLFISVAVALTGCPKFAYVALFNHSDHEVRVSSSGGEIGSVAPGRVLKFRFGGETIEIQKGNITWTYGREIPHGGENGPFFDGTLRVQLENDGRLYALKKEVSPPLDDFNEQPDGFPLIPKEPNKAPLRAPVSVTPAAGAAVAPPPGAAGL